MTTLYQDTETFSSVNLFTAGVHAYSEAPDAEVMLWAYALDDDAPQVWDLTEGGPMPAALARALDDPAILQVWQNSHFDRTMIRNTLGIELPLEQIEDTMIQGLAHGLPGGLDKLCSALKIDLDEAKDKRGKQLIHRFCKPLPKNMTLRRATRLTHPEEWEEFKDYACQDIVAMRAVRRKLPTWNTRPSNSGLRGWDQWRLDQRINDRGVLMDVDLAKAAISAVAEAKIDLDADVYEMTDEAVDTGNQRDALLKYILSEHGVELPDMKAGTLEKRLADESLPDAVRELIVLRMDTATTSVGKYKKVLSVVSRDNRARALIQFCGASRTGRDAGRLVQPQNFPRPTMSGAAVEVGIEALKSGMADILYPSRSVLDGQGKVLSPGVAKVASNALRGLIIAPPGRKLVVSDLSNIEGVVGAWLAGEDWKLKAYADVFADPTKPDMYKLAYARSFGVSTDAITKAQRQLGKIQELALAYEGGVGAFVTFVMTYKMDLNAVADAVLPTLSAQVLKDATGMWNWRRSKHMTTYGLTERVFVACEALKALWREAHPQISSYWKELENAAKTAMLNPGDLIPSRRLGFIKNGAWLRMILPNGDSVCYPSAHVERGKIIYQGVNQYTRQWGRIGTYGGKLFENADQATARDVLFSSKMWVEEAGYDILLPAHDELITETPDDPTFSAPVLSSMMATQPWWAEDLPLKAEGFEAYRYRKDE